VPWPDPALAGSRAFRCFNVRTRGARLAVRREPQAERPAAPATGAAGPLGPLGLGDSELEVAGSLSFKYKLGPRALGTWHLECLWASGPRACNPLKLEAAPGGTSTRTLLVRCSQRACPSAQGAESGSCNHTAGHRSNGNVRQMRPQCGLRSAYYTRSHVGQMYSSFCAEASAAYSWDCCEPAPLHTATCSRTRRVTHGCAHPCIESRLLWPSGRWLHPYGPNRLRV
jgi:hypothetical protein